MKRKLITSLVTVCIGLSIVGNVQAQDSTTAGQDLKNFAKKSGKAIGRTAKKIGNKTAELASKGKSDVVDKTYKGKQGPNGETIYIDSKSKYYSVDTKGHHHYYTESQLKDKTL